MCEIRQPRQSELPLRVRLVSFVFKRDNRCSPSTSVTRLLRKTESDCKTTLPRVRASGATVADKPTDKSTTANQASGAQWRIGGKRLTPNKKARYSSSTSGPTARGRDLEEREVALERDHHVARVRGKPSMPDSAGTEPGTADAERSDMRPSMAARPLLTSTRRPRSFCASDCSGKIGNGL